MEYDISSLLSLISHIHTLSADFSKQRLAGTCRFASSHGYILYLLSVKGTLTMGELAESINRDKSTTTVLIRKLKEAGLITEESSKTDSRAKCISLTEAGTQYNELTAAIAADLLRVSYDGFSEQEKETLLALLKKMSDNIEAALDSPCIQKRTKSD